MHAHCWITSSQHDDFKVLSGYRDSQLHGSYRVTGLSQGHYKSHNIADKRATILPGMRPDARRDWRPDGPTRGKLQSPDDEGDAQIALIASQSRRILHPPPPGVARARARISASIDHVSRPSRKQDRKATPKIRSQVGLEMYAQSLRSPPFGFSPRGTAPKIVRFSLRSPSLSHRTSWAQPRKGTSAQHYDKT
ncbi:hypothetical protein E4U32_005984 [Claviceps aff. humidiphila group G2b]|nr:hypothetical protein E4U32_005984 [Claviceps aff. humidiphila group G2b]